MIEYLCWSPDKATFVQTMLNQRLYGQPICRLPREGEVPSDGSSVIWVDGIACHEIGTVIKTPSTHDDEGNEITPAVVIPGYHANMIAFGWLADFLNSSGGWTGILALLGEMDWQASEVGEPAALVGTSGVKIYPAMAVDNRVAKWA